jgi:hypothetical protein
MSVAQKLRQWEATIKKDNDDVPWSLCLANHATKEFNCPKATTILHAAFQHVLHASMSWSGTRMDWIDGMGSVRNCKRRAGAGRLCWAKSIDRQWAMPAGREKKGRTKRWREDVDCAAGQDNASGARRAWELILSCGAGRQPARHLRTSPTRPAAVQDARASLLSCPISSQLLDFLLQRDNKVAGPPPPSRHSVLR